VQCDGSPELRDRREQSCRSCACLIARSRVCRAGSAIEAFRADSGLAVNSQSPGSSTLGADGRAPRPIGSRRAKRLLRMLGRVFGTRRAAAPPHEYESRLGLRRVETRSSLAFSWTHGKRVCCRRPRAGISASLIESSSGTCDRKECWTTPISCPCPCRLRGAHRSGNGL